MKLILNYLLSHPFSNLSIALIILLFSFVICIFHQVKPKPFLNKSIQQIELIKKENISHDTLKLRFSILNNNYVLGLPCGNHVKFYFPNVQGKIRGEWNNRPDYSLKQEEISKSYTPISLDDARGYVDFIIKIYKPCNEFPDGGKVTQYIDKLNIGDSVNVSGPFGRIKYHGYGSITQGNQTVSGKRLILIAGGSGITPILQVLQRSFSDRNDNTQFWLLYANKSEDDILMRDMLEEMAVHNPQLIIHYTIDNKKNNTNWKYSLGHINEDMLREHLPPPSEDTLCLMCGPLAMTNLVCRPNLIKLGWDFNKIFEF